MTACRRHEIWLIKISFIEIRPRHEVRHLVRCNRPHGLVEPVRTLVACLRERSAARPDEDACLRHGCELVMRIREIVHNLHRRIKALHPAIVLLRIAMIGVEPRDVDERVPRIAREVISSIGHWAARRVRVKKIVQPLDIAQILHGVTEEVLVLARRAVRRAPPEPAAVVFMERAENHGHMFFLQDAEKICDHVEIAIIDRIEVAARHDTLHDAAARVIRRVTCVVIPSINFRTFRNFCKIWHVTRHCENGALLRSRQHEARELRRIRLAVRAFRIRELELVPRQRQAIHADNA